MSDSELTLALNEIGITSDARHVRFVSASPDGKRVEWPHDVWSVTLHHGDKTHTTEFKCGIGHYVERLGWLDDVKAAEAAFTADVLACLLSDASNASETFEEWCSNFGYSDDSMKAMEIYRACQKTRAALQRFLGPELIDRLGSLEH